MLTMSQILSLAHNKSEIERRVHAVIDKFAERGLRSLAVAYQVTGDTCSSSLIQDSKFGSLFAGSS